MKLIPRRFRIFPYQIVFRVNMARYPSREYQYSDWFSPEKPMTLSTVHASAALARLAKQGALMEPGVYLLQVQRKRFKVRVNLYKEKEEGAFLARIDAAPAEGPRATP